MSRIVKRIFILLSISLLIYLGIAFGFVYFSEPNVVDAQKESVASDIASVNIASAKEGEVMDKSIDFSQMMIDYSDMPSLQSYRARDGASLDYRYYPSDSNKLLILLHGSGWHSQQFYPLAKYISEQGLAQVVTPDLRGHGLHPQRRGDIDYIGQFEDDLADLIDEIRPKPRSGPIIMGGHSSGGGLAIRFAGGQYGQLVDAYLLLAPFIFYNAPTTRPNAGGWAKPYTARIIGLTMFNNLGIHQLDYLTCITFNMPKEVRNGTETLAYSFRLNTSFSPRDYKQDLSSITQPLLLIAGTADETMFAEQYLPLISLYTQGRVELLSEVNHMGVVVGAEVRPVVKSWLEEL